MVMAVSERRACRAVGQHRSTQRRPVPPNPYRDRLVARMRDLAMENPRRGRRYIMDLLHREGWTVGNRLMKRLWRIERLLVPQERRKRRRIGTGENGIKRRRAALPAPLLHCRRDELRAVVAADVPRCTPDRRQLVQERHDVLAAEVPLDLDRQALPRVLVQHHQHPEGAAVRRPVLHEVHAPHLVLPRRTATHDPVLACADPPALHALLRHQ